DHERIGEADARSLLRAAETGLTLVTTTKDAARLKSLGPNARKAGDVAVPITVTAELSPSLSTLLANVMGAA
ncbi:MAG: tetraacyldisaccharide 4'-kinase, partial [Pseudomonadota bacterium]